MVGVIYKLTIVSKVKMDGYKPFYIGQHYCLDDNDVSKFIDRNFVNYYGSGKIWNDFISSLKKLTPSNWYKFIKCKILYSKENISQKALDTLEAHFIRKYKSHYSFRLGGCNVLWGTANKFGSGSPMTDENVRKARSEYMKEYYKTHKHPCLGRKLTKEQRKKLSDSHKGIVNSRESIERTAAKLRGRKRSKEFSELMREIWNKRKLDGWVSPVRGRKQSKEVVEKRRLGKIKFNKEHPGYNSGWKMSEDSKRKISLALKGRKRTAPVTQSERDNKRLGAYKGWEKRRKSLQS